MTTIRPHLAGIYTILAALLMTLTLSGCHTTARIPGGNVESALTDATTAQLYTALAESYSPWSDVYMPVTLSMESPKKMSISGRATMVYGSEIHMSLRVLGIEAGVVYINTETMYVVDKYHKCYYQMETGPLLGRYGLTLADLQEVLLGRAVVPGMGVIKADDCQFSFLSSDESWILTPLQGIRGADWHYTATKTDPPLLTDLSLRVSGLGAMICRYAEPSITPAGVVDALTTLTIPYRGSDIAVSLIWRLDDARWDSGREIKFTPPGPSYKRLDIESVLKAADDL